MSLDVIEPGLLTSVQDGGRPDWAHLGVPTGGACDPWSLAIANLLIGNRAGAAALEMTLLGGTFRARSPLRIGLAGADLGGLVRETGRVLSPGYAYTIAAGSTISFPGVAEAQGRARAYLALPGGIDAPVVLGSRSTALSAGFGGLDGRAIRSGDRITARTGVPNGGEAPGDRPAPPGARAWPESTWPSGLDDEEQVAAIRVVRGPWDGIAQLVGQTWRVGAGSDRVGLRLEGPPIDHGGHDALPSFGVVPGSIQVPADGAPIVLLADAQTTGGYPVAAVTIAADMWRVAQLRPGAEVRFEEVTIAAATDALRRQQLALERGAALLREAATWDAVWQSAGG